MANTFNLLRPFLSALRTQIVNDGVFADANCQLTLLEDNAEQFPQGSPILEIVPGDFRSLGWDAGGGIQDLAIRGTIQFRIIIMNVLDTLQTDVTAMTSTDQALGVYELMDQLIDELEMLMLCDGNGNTYLLEPMRLERFSKPQRIEKHPEWIVVNLWFETKICQQIIGVT
jgi:hypothetical protein